MFKTVMDLKLNETILYSIILTQLLDRTIVYFTFCISLQLDQLVCACYDHQNSTCQ